MAAFGVGGPRREENAYSQCFDVRLCSGLDPQSPRRRNNRRWSEVFGRTPRAIPCCPRGKIFRGLWLGLLLYNVFYDFLSLRIPHLYLFRLSFLKYKSWNRMKLVKLCRKNSVNRKYLQRVEKLVKLMCVKVNLDSFTSFIVILKSLPRITLLYSFGHWGSYSLLTKKPGSLNDWIAICADETVRIECGT